MCSPSFPAPYVPSPGPDGRSLPLIKAQGQAVYDSLAITRQNRHNCPYSTKVEIELSDVKQLVQVTQLAGGLAGIHSRVWQMPRLTLITAKTCLPGPH